MKTIEEQIKIDYRMPKRKNSFIPKTKEEFDYKLIKKMTTKQFIKGISNPINWWYVIQAKYKKFIKKQYNKIYQEDNIDTMMFKVAQCPNCYLNGVCNGNLPEEEGCGCNFKSMIISDKSCPNGRF